MSKLLLETWVFMYMFVMLSNKPLNLKWNLIEICEHRNCICNVNALSFVALNVWSVSRNFSVFKADVHNFIYDEIELSETCLETEIELLYSLPNYNMHCVSRITKGGETLL